MFVVLVIIFSLLFAYAVNTFLVWLLLWLLSLLFHFTFSIGTVLIISGIVLIGQLLIKHN